MKPFAGWRAVGRAMLDARRREGVTAPRTALDNEGRRVVILDWKCDGINVRICWRRGEQLPFDIGVNFPDRPDGTGKYAGIDGVDDAAEALRVLAALDLIPDHLADAYAADERYGRCEVCGLVARWWHEPPFTARWVHIQPWVVTGPNAHRAEVAE